MANGTDCHRELLKDKCSFAWIFPQAFCVFYDKLFIIKWSIPNLFTETDDTWEVQEISNTKEKLTENNLPPKFFFFSNILYIDFKKLLNKPKATEGMPPI